MPGGSVAGGGAGVTGDAGRIDVAVVDDHPIIRDGMTGWVAVPLGGKWTSIRCWPNALPMVSRPS